MPAFRHLPVTSLIDATHNFEQIESERATELQGLRTSGGAGAWTNAESFSAKLEETTSIQVRKEGTSVRLKGFCKAKEEAPAKTALFTLPVGFRPPVDVLPVATEIGFAAFTIRVKTTGVVENEVKLTAGRFAAFDGITFQLT